MTLSEIKAAAEAALSKTVPVVPGIPDAFREAVRAEKALAYRCLWLIGRVEELAEALRHYAGEGIWEDDEGFWYFGRGVSTDEPWTVARAALARLEGE